MELHMSSMPTYCIAGVILAIFLSRPQVTGGCGGIAACRLVLGGCCVWWLVSQWASWLKCLKPQCWKKKMPEHFCDPQTGDIWLTPPVMTKEWPVSWSRKSFQHRWILSSRKPLKRFQCKALFGAPKVWWVSKLLTISVTQKSVADPAIAPGFRLFRTLK